jgi:DNA-binding response OmpR family regulator
MADLVLVVDDEVDVTNMISRSLMLGGFEVMVAHRGADALQLARHRKPSLVVLDIMMPGMNGIDVCRHVRANPELRAVPILFLTARHEIEDKIDGFEAGADDYLTKPFDLREMELRVRALLRRSRHDLTATDLERIEVGELVLDCNSYEITAPDRVVLLTPVEFELVHFLMRHPGHVYSADDLLQEVWGYPPGTGMPDLVRVHIKNLRDKIELAPRDPKYIRNVLRRGYMIVGAR